MSLLLLALLAAVLPSTPLVSLTIRWNYALPPAPAIPPQTGFQVQGCQTTWTEGCVMQNLFTQPLGPRQLQAQIALPVSAQWLCVQVIALGKEDHSPPSDRVCRYLSAL